MTKWLLSISWYLLNPQLQQSFTYCAVVVISFSSRLPWQGTVNQLLGSLKVSGRWFMSQAEQNLVKLTYFQCGWSVLIEMEDQDSEVTPAQITFWIWFCLLLAELVQQLNIDRWSLKQINNFLICLLEVSLASSPCDNN